MYVLLYVIKIWTAEFVMLDMIQTILYLSQTFYHTLYWQMESSFQFWRVQRLSCRVLGLGLRVRALPGALWYVLEQDTVSSAYYWTKNFLNGMYSIKTNKQNHSSFIIPRRSQRDIVLAASVRPSIPSVLPSVRTFCLAGTISQYLLVRFYLFLVQMIRTMDSRYPISLVKIDPLTLELLPLFN